MNRHCALVLHAHVPWVRHPESPRCLEEDWFFEAVTETYIPLVETLLRLREEGVAYQLTINLSPPLLGMMADSLMQDRVIAYLARAEKLAGQAAEHLEHEQERKISGWYTERFQRLRELYVERWNRDLISQFRSLQESGHLEIMASGATHGLLPIHLKVPETVRTQIDAGCQLYEECFGESPKGFWLPECAYAPALVPFLQNAGIEWTLVEEHGLTSASPPPKAGPYHPVRAGDSMSVFARDSVSSRQVWSAESGYPGDPRYREFYRDLGLELPDEALEEYLEGSGLRRFTGIKLFRVTGETEDKEIYDPREASRVASEHALHFVESRAAQLADLESKGVDQPIVVSAFDAELFGHWWFEGPEFLEHVLRHTAGREDFQLTTPGKYVAGYGEQHLDEKARPISSSWGEGGYFETWLSEENTWIYPHIHRRAEQLLRAVAILEQGMAVMPDDVIEHRKRCLRQMTRELLQAQASDWAFLMRNGAARPYAVKRTEDHLENFDELWGAFGSPTSDAEAIVDHHESANPIFPNLRWNAYGQIV